MESTIPALTLAEFKQMVPTLNDKTTVLQTVIDLYGTAEDASTITRAKIMAQTLLNHGADRSAVEYDDKTEFGRWIAGAKIVKPRVYPAKRIDRGPKPDNAEHAQLVRIAKRLGVRTIPAKGLALRIIRHLEQ